ncbi:serine hydrolase domain-containing protein [Micromonospora sp. NBC_01796]|uniref:serine hydrolase domain-containing protein n=1 Tax=Micromonospora sp. NBC_01796 TaxID=2975987 RepID=UPI002DDB4087|nr:serine hydrolase domain-containing protein [Micromonospora sp. NBC_01796]WSA87479.1 beta-lactamase family protein [Micromonospora sp. NBC_01796]
MRRTGLDRRTFGKLIGAAGAGTLTGGALVTAPARAAAPTWKVTGTAVTALKSFDDTMKSFMQARNISAGQLAVTHQGRLVLARGYSYSDDPAQTVAPTSLFRIASLSKSVTAAALARLAQDGAVALGTPVASLLDLTPPAGQTADPRLSRVTLWQLLQHTGGWDRALAFDPNFADRTISRALGVPMELYPADVIRYMAGQPLQHDPGTRVAYSNFGYQSAGRVIEAVSGLPYAMYVQQKLLAPLGITRMAQGWSIAPHAGEVRYRSQYTGPTVLNETGATVAAPYGAFSMRLQDANGGWIGSAVDLVRWASAFDAAGPVLNSTSLGRVWAVPGGIGVDPAGWYYGLGWQVRPVTTGGTGRNTWHTGSMPGTYSLLVRTYQGRSWAVLFNQRDDASGLAYPEIDPLLWAASAKVTTWPTTNLYPNYF